MKNDFAVSELIGAILLVSLVTLAASIIAVTVLSQPPPEDIPQITAIADNQSQTVYLLHTGGDSLRQNEIKTYVNGQDSPFSIANGENWPWTAGKTLKVEYPGSGMPEYIQLVYTGGSSQTLILTAYFVPSVITGAPTGLPTTSPTTIPTTIPTTLPTTVPTTTTSPTPTPTPTCGYISGTIFTDLNNNCIPDPGETRLQGWTAGIFYKTNNTLIKETITNSDGYFIFSDLRYSPAEQYVIDVVRKAGWKQTCPKSDQGIGGYSGGNEYKVTLNPANCYETGLDFAYCYYC